MRAYNSRKTPREIYLFRKRGKKIALTKYRRFFLDGDIFKADIHGVFQVIGENKYAIIRCTYSQKWDFEKQLMKILKNKPKEVSISSMIAYFKGINDSGKCTIDFSKIQRKDFVSRNITKITNLLKEKGILKEKGVEN